MGRKTGSQRREDHRKKREERERIRIINARKKAIEKRAKKFGLDKNTVPGSLPDNYGETEKDAFNNASEHNKFKPTNSSISFNIKKPIWARGGILRYPLEAMTDSTDYLQIDIGKYVPVKGDGDFYVGAPGSRRAKRKSDVPGGLSNHSLVNKGTILLQIPANIQDGNSTSYGDSKMNTIVGAAVGGAQGFMENVGDALGAKPGEGETKLGNARDAASKMLTKTLSATGVGGEELRKLITKKLASSVVNTFGGNVSVNQLLARESGQVFNPNMELLFNGPTLRNFRFSFKMMPRSRDEAEQIKLIIRTFKMNMAPKVTSTSNQGTALFLDTPSVFELRYKSGRRNHPFLHKFKQCFLTDIAVNYTAEGVYATYENKEPIAMIMDLTFKELEPIYDIDYLDDSGSDRDNTVGF
tara:strand:- start:98 stop:1333 length:1236 start_codon:yes stop_codon:yes gene_type:complete